MFDLPAPIRKATDTQSDRHDEQDRISELRDSTLFSLLRGTHNRKQYPNRESALKLILHGDSRSLEEMDDAHPEVKRGPQPLRHPL